LPVVPPLAVDPVLETCLLEVTGQVAAPQPGLPARNVLPAANQHEQTAHQQAASDRIADDAVVLLDANVGQAGVAGNDPPGYLPCQTGASLPTVTAPRSSATRDPLIWRQADRVPHGRSQRAERG